MRNTDVRIDWIIFAADTRELVACVEDENGAMIEIRKVGSWSDDNGEFKALVRLDPSGEVHQPTSGKNFNDLRDEILMILHREWDDAHECGPCHGSGLFATSDWHSPEVPCDFCGGTGQRLEVTE